MIYLQPFISPGNDFEVYVRARKRNPSAPGQKIAASGLSVSFVVAATDTGGAIAGTGTVTCPEAGTTGEYLGALAGLTLTTALASIANDTTLYVIVTIGTSGRRVLEVKVRKTLAPDAA